MILTAIYLFTTMTGPSSNWTVTSPFLLTKKPISEYLSDPSDHKLKNFVAMALVRTRHQ